ncbi:hypothetical protein SDC9_54059 [bioreactor metagenome]|uniref:DUF5362 domain-containing protein n=1 Tax=bioreactor metagenome TaxID=1076179 RepID=A0A644WVC3_9ZZZZ
MEQQPNQFQDPNQQYNQQPPQMSWENVINDHIAKTRGWMMFVGVFMIVYAALATIVSMGLGIIFAWVPFIMGLFLINGANRAKTFLLTGSQADLADYHKQLKNFFLTNGILLIVGLSLMVIFIIIALAVGIHYNPSDFSKGFNF